MGSFLLTFLHTVSAQPSMVKQDKTLTDGADRLSQNVGNKLPINGA